jgi:hypothetical protein
LPYKDPEQRKAYARQHYVDNKPSYIRKAMRNNDKVREEVRKFLAEYLADKSCVDCGEADPIVLEFDHRGDKEFAIATPAAELAAPSLKRPASETLHTCGLMHRNNRCPAQS